MCKVKRTMNGTEFDVFSNGFVKITKANAENAKNAIMADTRYKKAFDKKDEATSAYMFENRIFERTLIKRVNFENSTRLSNNEMDIIADNLKSNNSVNSFLDTVANKQNEQINYEEMVKLYNGCSRTLLSFASKYCHFYLLNRSGEDAADMFPIFDSILRRVILLYYNGEDFDGFAKAMNTGNNKISDVKTFYSGYVNALKKIGTDKGVSVTGVEQLLWWFYKDIDLPTMKEIRTFRNENHIMNGN